MEKLKSYEAVQRRAHEKIRPILLRITVFYGRQDALMSRMTIPP